LTARLLNEKLLAVLQSKGVSVDPLAWKEALSYGANGTRVGYQVSLGLLLSATVYPVTDESGVQWTAELWIGAFTKGQGGGSALYPSAQAAMAAAQASAMRLLNDALFDVYRMLLEPPSVARRRAQTQTDIPIVKLEGEE
jgi:hypothetical protein